MMNNSGGGADVLMLEEKLDRIRSQLTSKLDNQKNLALILTAVEENIDEQKNDRTAVAYFVSFLALLEQSVDNDAVADASVAGAAAYFLDVVLPFTPAALLKQKFGPILTKLAPVLTSSAAEPALLRLSVGALESLLLAQDHLQWLSSGNVSPKRALVGMLELLFDPRPKVRKRAQEAVHKILANPPASPAPTHAAAALCGELALKRLVLLVQAAPKNKKGSGNKESVSGIVHALQLISSITSANAWPPAQVEALCDVLLEVSRTSDQYLVAAAFQAFDGLFSSMSHDIDVEKFTRVLDIIFDLKPPVDDAHLAASWLAVVANGLQSFAKLLPHTCVAKIPSIFPIVADFLVAELRDIYLLAAQCLIAIVSCIPDEYLLQPSATNGVSAQIYEDVDETITFVAELISKDLFSIKYQHATKEILELVTATLLKLRIRANPDFIPVIETVGQWRSNEESNFPHNKEAEDVLAAAISTMGPEVVLGVLPLNLTGQHSDQPGRAWLLPLLRDNVRFSSLQYYKQNILPLTQFFTEKIESASNKESINVKIFQTILDQVWSLLPHFCDLPTDLGVAFDDAFASSLAELLYSNVDLRVTVCHALRLLVESNLAYSQGALEDDLMTQQEMPIAKASENLEFLASKASNLLSVLFNVFSSTLPDSRGFVLETIDTYLQIVPKSDLETTFNKVCGLLKTAMDDEAQSTEKPAKNQPPQLSITMMDLVVAMAKYVPESSYNALFAIFLSTVSLEKNALMQKRSYRIISKLSESESGEQAINRFLGEIENVFVQTTGTTHTSARAARLIALTTVVQLLPSTDLHFIPSVLQEVIMSTKDVNERSREASYALLIQMASKMSEGGIVCNNKVPGFDPESADTEASLTQFFTMVSAGLAAQSQHMISATITAISCLVYEFKDQLPQDVLIELASTVELFLTHNSKEIAKSAIGFVKVEVLSLPEEIVRANLPEMLTKLLKWSHEHRGHFKSKVKHIVERLIRKFGVEAVEEAIPEEDRKLVANIKKSRARAKRKDAEAAEAEKADGKQEKKFMSAYEEAVYDSDSDEEDVEEKKTDKSKRKKGEEKYILDNGDEPLNLLDRQTLAHISSSKPKKFTKKDMERHNVETKNGKIVFKDMVSKNDDPLANKSSGIDAYLDAVKQAPVRGQKNKLKFKKSKDEDNWSDSEDEVPAPKAQKTKTMNRARVSKPKQKFKARKKL